jgi:hypothetical protein
LDGSGNAPHSCCRRPTYRSISRPFIQASEPLWPRSLRQFESLSIGSKRSTARRTRVAQTWLSISARARLTPPCEQSRTAFLHAGSGRRSGKLDSHILRAFDLRTRVRRLTMTFGMLTQVSPAQSPGIDAHDYATTMRIRLLDEGVDQYFQIGLVRKHLSIASSNGFISGNSGSLAFACSTS